MLVIENHQLTEQVLTDVLGWEWMSFVGIPVKGTDGYPEKCRVRQLMSPKALKPKRWKDFFEANDGREAVGDEPLAYCYCSSGGPEIPPRIMLLVDG